LASAIFQGPKERLPRCGGNWGCLRQGARLRGLAWSSAETNLTGDRTILGKISKRGNRYLRVLFVQAAWVVLVKVKPARWAGHGLRPWIEAAKKRLHHNVLAIPQRDLPEPDYTKCSCIIRSRSAPLRGTPSTAYPHDLSRPPAFFAAPCAPSPIGQKAQPAAAGLSREAAGAVTDKQAAGFGPALFRMRIQGERAHFIPLSRGLGPFRATTGRAKPLSISTMQAAIAAARVWNQAPRAVSNRRGLMIIARVST
jgi:hypothetical protein